VQSSESAVRNFIARINEHDVAGVVALCSAEHRFVDSLGHLTVGLERLREAWSGYFALFPDYRIEIELLLTAGDAVLLAGWASATAGLGTPKQQHWRIPAAWRATTRGDLLDSWQVYADNKPVYELLARDV
jgi:ketosteroid isomerase-like protein